MEKKEMKLCTPVNTPKNTPCPLVTMERQGKEELVTMEWPEIKNMKLHNK